MQKQDIKTPRVLIACTGLLITGALMFTNNISTAMGTMIIIGILVAFGAYVAPSPSQKGK